MEFYESAKKLIGDNFFFTKWEHIIPIIVEDENSVTVVFVLAEAFSRNFSFYFQIIFDKKTNNVVGKSNGFNFNKKFESYFKNIKSKD